MSKSQTIRFMPLETPASPRPTTDRIPSNSGKMWAVVRTTFILLVCFWIGYLMAVIGPSLEEEQKASIKYRYRRFSDYLGLRGKLFDSTSGADDVLRRSVLPPSSDSDSSRFNYVLIPLTSVDKMQYHKQRFEACMQSILDKSTIPLHFYFVVDEPSKRYLKGAMRDFEYKFGFRIQIRYDFLDQQSLAAQLAPYVSVVQRIVSGNTKGYYNQSIFFLSVGIHKNILPDFVHRIIMLDTDLKFLSDIEGLFAHFDNFGEENVMGLAYDQQPTYRDAFSVYRMSQPNTRVGSPPSKGFPGFNSGVLLLNIDRMRSSKIYNVFLDTRVATALTKKYSFMGQLGDQDFYSLVGNEKENLFYVLPCSWNRHLCRNMYQKYPDVFESYFNCDGKIHVYHGSCNTTIPV
ncbi:xyloside xylosyltransferase 1-like [Diadema antillarum]|uniref:xyloside xylosyltransferase 1-like n=1 Tax=Diadema antillarum TaxID=105358 RepID=UPI003A851E79